MILRHAPRNLQGLPTLTEVIDLPPVDHPVHPAAAVAARPPVDPPRIDPAPPALPVDEDELLARVLADVQRHVEPVFDQRLRVAIQAAMDRAGEALVRELRAELDSALHDVVARAVGQELARRRAE